HPRVMADTLGQKSMKGAMFGGEARMSESGTTELGAKSHQIASDQGLPLLQLRGRGFDKGGRGYRARVAQARLLVRCFVTTGPEGAQEGDKHGDLTYFSRHRRYP